jgi:GAF domain-containing protein
MCRYTIGRSGSVLEEKGLLVPGEGTAVGRVRASGRPLITGTEDGSDRQKTPEMQPGSSMKSRLTAPLFDNARLVGVVTVGSEQPGAYTRRHLELLGYIAGEFAQMIRNEKLGRSLAIHRRRMACLDRFVEDIRSVANDQEAYEQTVRLLSDELKTCLVRISIVDDDETSLKSRAMISQRPIESVVPADGRMMLSLMDRHRKVIQDGRKTVIYQGDMQNRMHRAEAALSLTEQLKSALLIPVKVKGRTAAIVSLAEMRNRERYRFDEDAVAFAEAVSRMLALALESLEARNNSAVAVRRDSAGAAIDELTTRYRLKSQVTNILGSVELLKTLPKRDDTSEERYLGMIDRSARKIHDYLYEKEAMTV